MPVAFPRMRFTGELSSSWFTIPTGLKTPGTPFSKYFDEVPLHGFAPALEKHLRRLTEA